MARVREIVQLASGGIILSTGLGVAAIYATNKDFFGVFLGFALFIFGYELSQYSVYHTSESRMKRFAEDLVESSGLIDLFMVLVGLGTVTYAFTILFQSLQETRLTLAIIAVIILFGGYMLTHYGINKTVV